MLCHHCRRLAATVVRRSPAALSRPLSTSINSTYRERASQLSTLRAPYTNQLTITRSYSGSSDATAASPEKGPSTEPQRPEKPDYLDDAESTIWDKLMAEFSPAELMVQDISGGCGSMYGIEIASEKFRGVNMLKQQRMVNAVLGDQMKGWHGVQLRTKVP
ncbi:bola-like protein [Hypoxylon crocopeplum]|nr:bola-like protein [Hypoxylon crocopeplum]